MITRSLLTIIVISLLLPNVFAQGQRRAAPVFVQTPQLTEISDNIEGIGTLAPKERVTLTVNAADRVTAVYFEDGQRVKKGQTLLAQAQREQLAAIEGAEATVREAENVVERMESLVADGVVSGLEFDQAKRDLEVAKSELTSVQTRQRDRVLVAPFDGVLGFRQVSVGAYLSPGDAVATLVDDSEMYVDVFVPDIALASIRPGLTITATTSSLPGEVFVGSLASIDNEIDPSTRSLRVRATLPNIDMKLRAGLFMNVTIMSAPREGLSLPESAIEPLGSRSFVYVAEGDGQSTVAKRVEVELGSRFDGHVEVLSGIDRNDAVITEGLIGVRDGGAISVRTEDVIAGSSGALDLSGGAQAVSTIRR
ncbi:MAG: efflux RND transporter periplasmic adaptor subunit [Pseudomonadota bacterium]